MLPAVRVSIRGDIGRAPPDESSERLIGVAHRPPLRAPFEIAGSPLNSKIGSPALAAPMPDANASARMPPANSADAALIHSIPITRTPTRPKGRKCHLAA
jgi:hypothetical protein